MEYYRIKNKYKDNLLKSLFTILFIYILCVCCY